LAALLATVEPRASDGDTSWRIVQGVEMGRRSVIDITATSRSGQVARVSVAGQAVPVAEGRLHL
jgi:predicted PhzF superfamily epimerase YddE/YHI9